MKKGVGVGVNRLLLRVIVEVITLLILVITIVILAHNILHSSIIGVLPVIHWGTKLLPLKI